MYHKVNSRYYLFELSIYSFSWWKCTFSSSSQQSAFHTSIICLDNASNTSAWHPAYKHEISKDQSVHYLLLEAFHLSKDVPPSNIRIRAGRKKCTRRLFSFFGRSV